jgi:hypothetical protein
MKMGYRCDSCGLEGTVLVNIKKEDELAEKEVDHFLKTGCLGTLRSCCAFVVDKQYRDSLIHARS